MDACSLRQDQQRGRARWWRSRLRSETGGSEQGRSILRHSADGGLMGARREAGHERAKIQVLNFPCRFRKLHPPEWRRQPNQNMIAVDDRNCRPFRPLAVRLLQVGTLGMFSHAAVHHQASSFGR